jgi:hypothetical protein
MATWRMDTVRRGGRRGLIGERRGKMKMDFEWEKRGRERMVERLVQREMVEEALDWHSFIRVRSAPVNFNEWRVISVDRDAIRIYRS